MINPGDRSQPPIALSLKGSEFLLCGGGTSLGLVEELLLLQSFFIPLLQGFRHLGFLVLDPLKFLLEPRYLGFFLLKGSVVRVLLLLQLVLQLPVGAPELLVVQEQTPEHLGPSIGALLKKGEVLILL